MGHIIEEMQIEETKVSFCNDHYRDKTANEISDILNHAASEAAKYIVQNGTNGNHI